MSEHQSGDTVKGKVQFPKGALEHYMGQYLTEVIPVFIPT